MSNINESHLAELARKATPGPWRDDRDRICNGQCGAPVAYHEGSCCDRSKPGCYTEHHHLCGTVAREVDSPHDAAFIAAASPDVVLSLLSALASAREDARRARMVASDAALEEITRLRALCREAFLMTDNALAWANGGVGHVRRTEIATWLADARKEIEE